MDLTLLNVQCVIYLPRNDAGRFQMALATVSSYILLACYSLLWFSVLYVHAFWLTVVDSFEAFRFYPSL